ncbi:MAG: sulfotransferase domain-containing protein [Ignavibacteriae bacterium]|nr:sulfotransferase domain-containing protein [Ignavibacteriota bacterium]
MLKLDFIGIGAQKAGSTWLSVILSSHPSVCLSQPKELNFFNDRHTHYVTHKPLKYEKSTHSYEKFFSHCKINSLKGEVCPNYFFDEKVPERIINVFPNIKLIACIRSPVDRAYSQYNMAVYKNKKEKRTFEDVFFNEKEYQDRGMYFKYLNIYLRYFDKSQIHIVTLDNIKNDPQSTANSIFKFLDIETMQLSKKIKSNSAVITKSVLFKTFVNNFARWLSGLGLNKLVIVVKNSCLKSFIAKVNYKNHNYPKLPDDLKKKYQSVFLDDINKLEKEFNIDLTSWKL